MTTRERARLHARLEAPTHTPPVKTRWDYTVRATGRGGRPASAWLTVRVVDPTGTAHPVQYGESNRDIVRRAFTGVFRDFVIWPPAARGIPLTFRVVVSAETNKVALSYVVTPR